MLEGFPRRCARGLNLTDASHVHQAAAGSGLLAAGITNA
jgi:hypothetical protein